MIQIIIYAFFLNLFSISIYTFVPKHYFGNAFSDNISYIHFLIIRITEISFSLPYPFPLFLVSTL